jgi:polyisoprenoid-binding protein YceI
VSRFRAVPEESRFWAQLDSNLHPVEVKAAGIYGFIEARFNGDGKLDPAAPHKAQLAFWVEDLNSGNELRDVEMLRRMNARSHPAIEWTVKKVSVLNGGRCRAAGDVTVHGRTRSFEDEFDISVAQGLLVVEGEHEFDMRDFGLVPPRFFWLWIEPRLKVGVRVVARQVSTGG